MATLAECFLEECRRAADSTALRAASEGLTFLRGRALGSGSCAGSSGVGVGGLGVCVGTGEAGGAIVRGGTMS
jgi:hypothetical protein